MDCQARGTKVRIIHHRETLYPSVPTALLLLHPPEGEHTNSGPIVSTTYQTILVLLDGSVGDQQALLVN
jgi:hypothetical protein